MPTWAVDLANGQRVAMTRWWMRACLVVAGSLAILPVGLFSTATAATPGPESASVFSGVLRDRDGSALSGVGVRLVDASGAFFFGDGNPTGADGVFSIAVAPGSYRVGLSSAGSALLPDSFYASSSFIDVSADVAEDLTIPNAFLDLTVTDAAGGPVAGAEVKATRGYSTSFELAPGLYVAGSVYYTARASDANGLGHFPVLPTSDLDLTITPPSHSGLAGTSLNDLNLTADTTHELVLPRYARLASDGIIPGTLTLSVDGPADSSLSTISNSSVVGDQLPSGALVLTGALAYTVHDVPSGGSVDVTLELPDESAPTAVFKLQDGAYLDVSSLASITGDTITLHLTDGGLGDDDGVANGVIVDPVIPVRAVAPSVPVAVTASPADAAATVDWSAPAGDGGTQVTHYRVYRDDVLVHTSANGSARSFTESRLANGHTYHYRVSAVNAAGEGPLSASAAVTPRAVVNATIVGTVTDDVTGLSVSGAGVALVGSSGRFVGGVEADVAGHYSVAVPAGDYRVEFIDGSGRHVGEWYDGHTLGDYAGAAVVHVAGGATVTANAALAPAGPTGAIAGAVTDTVSSGPINHAWVVAVRSSDGAIVGGALADGSGHYTIGGLNAGSYRLAVLDPTMAHRLELFYQNRADFGTADNITVTAGHTTTINTGLDPVTPPPTANATISGTVSDEVTGQPVRGAGVAVVDSSGRFVRGVEADAAGHYTVGVAAGDYRVEFIDGSGRHLGEWYDGHNLGDYAGSTVVHVGAGATVTADAALVPAGPTGAIAGAVTDTATSGPIDHAWVVAVRSSDGAIVGGALADGAGRYTIGGLYAGSYRLAVLDPTMAHGLELFYQNRADFGTADNIAVTAGHTTTINAGLDRAAP